MSTNGQTGIPLNNGQQVQSLIALLQEKLQTAAPDYASTLHTVHKMLANDDEIVHLLSEEEIGTICRALAKKMNVVLVETAAKSGKTADGKKKLSSVTLEDL